VDTNTKGIAMARQAEDVEALFMAALEKATPQERGAYIAEACAGSPEVLRRLRELLHAHEESQGPLDAPPPGLGETVDLAEHPEAPGTHLGPYKLLEQIGEGGMGTIWMAEQHEPVRRLVALKVIKAGMDSAQVVARFEAERQALALMDHPNIARVFDGGTTASGRPFFVMELVKGTPITKYCDEHRLTPRQRLELFVPVCQAIQHAHQKGIIHRDVKPSNVLVAPYDGKPVVKVIDFGVAKATGQRLTERTLFTGFGAVVGTLEYMSPEQAELNNQDIDMRSDIYSLGVLLYELLTGSTPLSRERLQNTPFTEMLRIIREEEPPKPSTRLSSSDTLPTIAAARQTEPAKLTRLLRGELDWIVMKALEKDRNRRYESGSAFAADVQRHLSDEPVQACPPSAGYRLRKFVRRNKRALATTTLLVMMLLVVVGTVAGSVGWVVRDQEARQLATEREAEAALRDARQLQDQGKWPEALEAAKRAEGLLAGGGSAALRQRIGELLADLEILSRVEEIRRDKADWMVRHRDGLMGQDLARAAPLYAAAFRRYGIDVQTLEPAEAAQQIARRAIRAELLAALVDWAVLTPDGGQRERLFQVVQAADPEPTERFRQWCQITLQPDKAALVRWAAADEAEKLPPAVLAITGLWLLDADCPVEAVSLLRRAQRRHPDDFWINHFLATALLREKPLRADEAVRFASAALAVRPRSARAYFILGVALTDQNRLPEAVAACRRALELEPDYFQAHYHLGKALWLQGKDAEAAAAFGDALKLKADDAQTHAGLGLVLFAQRKFPEAAKEFEQGIKYQDKYAKAYVYLGNALLKQGKVQEAMERYRKAKDLDPKLANASFGLGLAFVQGGKTEAAAGAFRQAIAVQGDHAGAHHNLGTVLRNLGKLDEAVAEYHQAIKFKPDNAETHCNLGHVLFLQGQFDEAAEHYSRAITLQPDYLDAEVGLGSVLNARDQPDKATDHFRKAIKSKPEALAYYKLARALAQQGEFAAALKAVKQAQDRLPPDDPLRLRPDLAQGIRQCERLIDLDRKLPDVLEGRRKPASALERTEFAQVCVCKKLFGAAALLYEEAFAEEPRLAEDWRSDHRYQAARAAASAGCGRGKEKPALGEAERARWRQQALEWLRTDLALANRQLKGATPQARSLLRQRLQKWLRERSLAGLRDQTALAELPKAERQPCLELWTEVEVFLVRARGPG
jgi:serine/threonine protein kinase/Tfp pilus assembly protein PilF